MMAVRAVNSCSNSILRSASFSCSPPLSAFRCRFDNHFRTLQFRRYWQLGCSRLREFRCEVRSCVFHDGSRRCSVHSLVDGVVEVLAESMKRKRVRSAIKLTSSGELLADKLVNQPLEKGLLLEFKKDSDRLLLAVAQRPDGKKNWMVHDQVLVETTNAAC